MRKITKEPVITLEELITESKKYEKQRIVLTTWHTAQEIAKKMNVSPREGRWIAEKLLRLEEVEIRIRKEPHHNTREYRTIIK